jgi:uncharacterized protein
MKPVDCPICKTRVSPEAKTFPFCCERCRLIDLGNWLGGKYAVAGEAVVDGRDADGDGEDE